jgi:hypothetical protein
MPGLTVPMLTLRASRFALRASRFALRASRFALRASRFALRASQRDGDALLGLPFRSRSGTREAAKGLVKP